MSGHLGTGVEWLSQSQGRGPRAGRLRDGMGSADTGESEAISDSSAGSQAGASNQGKPSRGEAGQGVHNRSAVSTWL